MLSSVVVFYYVEYSKFPKGGLEGSFIFTVLSKVEAKNSIYFLRGFAVDEGKYAFPRTILILIVQGIVYEKEYSHYRHLELAKEYKRIQMIMVHKSLFHLIIDA